MKLWLTMVAVLATTPAFAQTCPTPAPLPSELAPFASPVAINDGGQILPGRAVIMTLAADPHFATPPSHPPAPGTVGGQAMLTVTVAGTYRIALGSGAWIDVLRGGKPLVSTAHRHGPACSPVRKMVEFVLVPGRYTLQFSGSAQPRLTVLVARLR